MTKTWNTVGGAEREGGRASVEESIIYIHERQVEDQPTNLKSVVGTNGYIKGKRLSTAVDRR